MTKKRIVIKNGMVCGFADEVSFDGLEVKEQTKQRVSRILPANIFLISLFCIVRTLCSDDSKMAAWTRTWGCAWRVIIDGKFYGHFKSRADAIAFEKEEIYKQGKLSIGGVA